MNQPYLLLLFFISFGLSAQNRSTTLTGTIKSDSLPIENVHIINKSSKEGSISDQNGAFSIKVKLNDTLLFSDIQFYLLELKVTKLMMDQERIDITLLQRINTLKEVVLKTHDLFGNLTIDSRKFNDSVQNANPFALKFEENYNAPSSIVANKLNPNYLPDVTDPMAPIGGDILGLTLLIFKPLIKEVSKIGKTKRELKKKERNYQKQAIVSPDKIRTELGDAFFINTLHISVEKIDEFIDYCKPKGIIKLFLTNKKLEMIDILIKESETFNNN